MSKTVRVIVVNADEEVAPELRSLLLGVDGVKIVAEVDEPALLASAVNQFPAEVLLIHLDPNPAAMMETVAPVIESRKDIAAIAMTEDRDAELVVRAMRAGMREFLWKPFPPEQLTEILRRLARQGTPGSTRPLGKLVSVVGSCGGVGSTTLATNLSVELSQIDGWNSEGGENARPRVAMVDLDFRFGQVAMFMDAAPPYTIAELCESPEQIERQMIERVLFKHSSGVHVLAHPHDMEQGQRISAAQCAGVLSALLEHYDFVVVDGPVRFDSTAKAVFDMTDYYLVVLQLVVPCVRNTDRMLQQLRRGGFNMDRIRLVCNRCNREAGYLAPADVEGTLGHKIHWMLPDDWKTSSTAVNVGSPLFEYAPKSKLRAAYRQIAMALANPSLPTEVADTGEPKKKLMGLFGNNAK